MVVLSWTATGSEIIRDTLLLLEAMGKFIVKAKNTRGGSITVSLTTCLTGLELAV